VIFWQFENYAPPNSEPIANAFARMSGYTAEAGVAEALYAGYKDWFLQDFRRPGFTIEAGSGVNPLPVEQLPDMYSRNEPILLSAPTIY
jgi:g-D-glutamyl-meso-diaminopimelate peptidase